MASARIFLVIEARKLAVAHYDLAVDDHRLNIARLGAVDDLAEDVVDRLVMHGVDVDENQIRALADFDGAAERVEPSALAPPMVAIFKTS